LTFSGHTEAELEEARQSLENILAGYADQAYRYCEQRTEDLHAILQALTQIEALAQDGPAGIGPHIAEIRKRLLTGRDAASTDPLTGLANRRELERQVKLRLASERKFCVLFFDIDDFGLFNDSLGRESGDAILKQLAERLNAQIRARDLAARWLADEFIVILECDIDNARQRAEQLSQWLRGPYTVMEEGREARLEVGISAAVAECGPGDTPRQIWLRLEEDFHRRHDAGPIA
jgi:diguanylate cyclase (GGDEF)-like protein